MSSALKKTLRSKLNNSLMDSVLESAELSGKTTPMKEDKSMEDLNSKSGTELKNNKSFNVSLNDIQPVNITG